MYTGLLVARIRIEKITLCIESCIDGNGLQWNHSIELFAVYV